MRCSPEATGTRLPHPSRANKLGHSLHLCSARPTFPSEGKAFGVFSDLCNNLFTHAFALIASFSILDADALNLLSRDPQWFETVPANCVLTPHPGEMARLCGINVPEVQADRANLALSKAVEWQQVVLLKGANTVIASPDGFYVILPYASSALSVAGSGDVLAGIIAGFAAQGKPAFDAAWLGAEIHARSGLLAAEKFGNSYSVMAGDILDAVPEAITFYSR